MRPGLQQARDRQFGAFAAWQVLCEYTRGEMRTRVESGEWVRVFRGVYREASTPPVPELRVEAARLSTGLTSVIAAYSTAAELHGLAVPATTVTHVFGARAARSGQLCVHRERVDTTESELIRGTLTTTAARTAVDIARTASPVAAAAVLEAAVAHGLSAEQLWREALRHRGRRGHAQALALIARCESDPVACESVEQQRDCVDLTGRERPHPRSECAGDIVAEPAGGVAERTVPGFCSRGVSPRAACLRPCANGAWNGPRRACADHG
ncbi:hypothetical protein [Nocardia arizonensis]|uniref:hypothetical protein n=1 Tax=Nocardia arizonensis TaxID=1141647 RepID=UPI0006D148B9|nr:hypothetical protein [Nocardia arizonensis]